MDLFHFFLLFGDADGSSVQSAWIIEKGEEKLCESENGMTMLVEKRILVCVVEMVPLACIVHLPDEQANGLHLVQDAQAQLIIRTSKILE